MKKINDLLDPNLFLNEMGVGVLTSFSLCTIYIPDFILITFGK